MYRPSPSSIFTLKLTEPELRTLQKLLEKYKFDDIFEDMDLDSLRHRISELLDQIYYPFGIPGE